MFAKNKLRVIGLITLLAVASLLVTTGFTQVNGATSPLFGGDPPPCDTQPDLPECADAGPLDGVGEGLTETVEATSDEAGSAVEQAPVSIAVGLVLCLLVGAGKYFGVIGEDKFAQLTVLIGSAFANGGTGINTPAEVYGTLLTAAFGAIFYWLGTYVISPGIAKITDGKAKKAKS